MLPQAKNGAVEPLQNTLALITVRDVPYRKHKADGRNRIRPTIPSANALCVNA